LRSAQWQEAHFDAAVAAPLVVGRSGAGLDVSTVAAVCRVSCDQAVSLQRVGAVMRKQVREFRRNRFVITTMAAMPLVFLVTPMITLFRIPDSATGTQVKAAVGVMSLLLLIVPIVIPPVIAAYSMVGERVQGTLEPVLTTPVRRDELLLGKAAATQQLATLAGLPLLGFTSLISFQVISPSVPLAVGLALALLAADVAVWRVVARMFDRERLFTGARSIRATRRSSMRGLPS
jgi:ABC-2 family transporter protein